MKGEILVKLRDPLLFWVSCQQEYISENCTALGSRAVVLHTLHHGSFELAVVDFVCKYFRSFMPYEGRNDGLFCFNKKHVLTIELLDTWLLDLCGTGVTFRDVFFSWESRSSSKTAGFHTINRQTANEALCNFLMLLRLPSRSDFNDLFSCVSCKVIDTSGDERVEGVVMGGTAMGILRALPQFERVSLTISPIPHISKKQYLMRAPRNRAFVDGILISARQNLADSEFIPIISAKQKTSRNALYNKFFYTALMEGDEEYAVSRFLKLCFSTRNSREVTVESSDVEDEQYDEAGGK